MACSQTSDFTCWIQESIANARELLVGQSMTVDETPLMQRYRTYSPHITR